MCMEDIYGRKLVLTEKRFLTQTGHHGCQLKLKRSNEWSFNKKLFAFVVLIAVSAYFFKYIKEDVLIQQQQILTGIFVILILISVVISIMLLTESAEESIIVIEDIGIQVIQYTNWWWSWMGDIKSHFIPRKVISDIIIHETIYRHRIIYYMAVLAQSSSVVKNEDQHNIAEFKDIKIIPIFTGHMPRQTELIRIYRAIRGTLFLNERTTIGQENN